MKNKKNIVIKLGTTSIIQDNMLNIQFIESLAKCIKTLHEEGVSTLIVTSGAVQLGANELNLKKRPTNLKSLQVASSIGQIELINSYKEIFQKNGLRVGQVLMSKNVLEDRSQFVNTTAALNELINQEIVRTASDYSGVALYRCPALRCYSLLIRSKVASCKTRQPPISASASSKAVQLNGSSCIKLGA